jgi:hypothetical protein
MGAEGGALQWRWYKMAGSARRVPLVDGVAHGVGAGDEAAHGVGRMAGGGVEADGAARVGGEAARGAGNGAR